MTSSPSPRSLTPEPEPTTPDRSWLSRHSPAIVVAVLVGLFVAGGLTLAFGWFTDSPAKVGGMATAGIMQIGEDGDGHAVLVAEGLAAGQTADGDVVLSNVGESAGEVTMSADQLTDTPTDPALSSVLTLRVLQEGAELYSGPLAGFTEVDLGTWQPDEKHIYTFTVTVAETAGPELADASTDLPLRWDITDGS